MHPSRRFGADQFKVIVKAINKTKIAGLCRSHFLRDAAAVEYLDCWTPLCVQLPSTSTTRLPVADSKQLPGMARLNCAETFL
jgi:hypothetical protein